MGVTQKLNQWMDQMQMGVKKSTTSFFTLFVKLVSGFMVGLTAALVGQELIAFGNFSFMLMLVTVWGLVLRGLWKMSFVGVIVFDLICVLVALLFRMYLLMAS